MTGGMGWKRILVLGELFPMLKYISLDAMRKGEDKRGGGFDLLPKAGQGGQVVGTSKCLGNRRWGGNWRDAGRVEFRRDSSSCGSGHWKKGGGLRSALGQVIKGIGAAG